MSILKDQDERELQEWLEKELTDAAANTPPWDQEDLEAYRVLFEVLEEEPPVSLPYDFSSKVVANIQARKDNLFDFRWNFILPLSLLCILVITYVSALYIDSKYAETVLQLFVRFKWQIIFGIFVFFSIQYLDQQFIKKKLLV
jgi:hypothetical protein